MKTLEVFGVKALVHFDTLGDLQQLANDLDMNLSETPNDPEGFTHDLVSFDDFGDRISGFRSLDEARAFLLGFAICKIKTDQAANVAKGGGI